jgi:hypothetical protein
MACFSGPILGVGLTGCTLGPDYQSPELSTPSMGIGWRKRAQPYRGEPGRYKLVEELSGL